MPTDGSDRDAEAAAAVRDVARAVHEYPADRFDGRGIVVSAGGARLLACAWVGLSVLRRHLGCTLPVELWHLGPDELGPVEASLFAELGVDIVDALEVRTQHPAAVLGGWELKPYTITNSRFREVLLLDADNVALRDPAFLFDEPRFRDTGALFWPDVTRIAADNGIWELCDVPFRNEPAWESGQVVLDKARAWAALAVARAMNDHSDVFFRYLHGDKDTFHLAWRMLEQPCGMTPTRARALPWGLVQHDFDGEVLFQHRNKAKWVLRGTNPPASGFHLAGECAAYLADLSSRWSGRIESLPTRSVADLDAETALAEQRLFQLDLVASDVTVIELLAGNRLGEGRTQGRLRWYVDAGELVLAGILGPSARLHPLADGSWQGEATDSGREQPVVLRPIGGDAGGPVAAVVAAVLERVADGAVPVDDAVTTLVTLGAIADLQVALVKERSRWADGDAAVDVVDRAQWRLGRRNPSLLDDGGDARRYG